VRKVLATVREDATSDAPAATTSVGLILVADAKEPYPCEISRLIEMIRRTDPNASGKESEDVRKAIADAQRQVEELGLDMSVMLSLTAISVAPGQLPEIADGFPPDMDRQIEWCAIVPTDRCLKASFKRMIEAAVKKEKPGLAKRAALAAMMPMIERKAVGMMKKGRQAALYEVLLKTRTDLSPQQRREKVAAYKERLGLNKEFDPETDDADDIEAEATDSE